MEKTVNKIKLKKGNATRNRQKSKSFRLIDLFSGAGGLSLGFSEAFGHKFKPVWANDFDTAAAQTYSRCFGISCDTRDIQEILKEDIRCIPKADVVIGGPPCQGFSLLNKNRLGDNRNSLWREFLKIVKISSAKVFLIENVPQLLKSKEFEEIIKYANRLGFQTTSTILCAADYGVAQKRFRAFILGCSFCDPNLFFPPPKTHFNLNNVSGKNQKEMFNQHIPWRTVRDVIEDLPSPIGISVRETGPPLDLHFGRTPTEKSLKRYRAIPDEGMNRFDLQKRAPELTPPCWIRKKTGGTDLFGRLWWDKPAFTIRTEFFKPEKGRYLHPSEHRPITHREAARIQSFPDSFVFHGSKIEIAKQIGNAVPPLLASKVADCVYAMMISH